MIAAEHVERLTTAFAIFCDEAGLDYQAGLDLAEHIGDELLGTAADREQAPGFAEGQES